MSNTNEMQTLIERLCKHHGVVDYDALVETEAFKNAYLAEHNKAPTVSAQSLVGKAIKRMRNVEQHNVDIHAHCIEPRYQHIVYEKGEGGKKGKNVCDAIGILAVTPDGDTKFVKFADYDPVSELADQFAAAGIPDGLGRGAPITLKGVSTYQDLLEGTTRITLGEESSIEAGGHNLPFPEGPDLERVLGQTAMERRQSAWKLIKKYGTINGRFGDTDGDPRPAVLTITQDKTLINVRTFEDMAPEDFHVQAPCFDRKGNGVSIKLPLSEVCEQLGIPPGSPREVIQAQVAGQRILVRGQGSLYHPKDPKDFGETEGVDEKGQKVKVLVFDQRIAELHAEGYLVSYGDNNYLRLSLVDKYVVDEAGNRTPQHSVRIGDKDVYDLKQKGVDDNGKPVWEVAVMAADEQKLPWMSVVSKTGTWDAGEEGTKVWNYNQNAFLLFLEGAGMGAELKEDDPFRKLASQMPLPAFIAKMQADQAKPAAPAAPAAAPANGAVKAAVPPVGSRLVNAPANKGG